MNCALKNINREIDRLDGGINEQMNDAVINSDVIKAPKACKNRLGILKYSTFLIVLPG